MKKNRQRERAKLEKELDERDATEEAVNILKAVRQVLATVTLLHPRVAGQLNEASINVSNAVDSLTLTL